MTALARQIEGMIRAAGPMTLADFMGICLTHPEHGYYTGRDPLGAAGDFTTAPEISQMFGELLGLCLAAAWQAAGAPNPAVLAELGPGRGTLMADLLRATRGVPGFHDAVSVHLVEVSPALRARQGAALDGYGAEWHGDIGTLPEAPLFLIANEFFDALPVRQFVRAGAGWAERVVGLKEDRLTLGLTDPAPVAALAHRLGDTREGDVVELCAPAAAIAGGIGARIAAHGGAALIVDYGGWHSLGDTVQAVRGHTPVGLLDTPGGADLTAHVDFEPLAEAARAAGAAHSALTPQGVFLERLGITARAQALAQNLTGSALENHIAAHRRLTHPDEMGHLFKVLALFARDDPTPPGLDP